MKKRFFLILGIAFAVTIMSCERAVVTKKNTKATENQNVTEIKRDPAKTYDFPYTAEEFAQLMTTNEQKTGWPKIKITATFGGWIWQNPNPCTGCDHCGCCFGLCAQGTGSAVMTNSELSQQELEDMYVLFDWVDDEENDRIVLIPNSNIDNGDGYLHNDDNNEFSSAVNTAIGRTIKLATGSYEIDFSEEETYPYGVVVVNTL